jgi:hypothetical protein
MIICIIWFSKMRSVGANKRNDVYTRQIEQIYLLGLSVGLKVGSAGNGKSINTGRFVGRRVGLGVGFFVGFFVGLAIKLINTTAVSHARSNKSFVHTRYVQLTVPVKTVFDGR